MSKYSDTFYNERDRHRTLYVTTCCPDVQDYLHVHVQVHVYVYVHVHDRKEDEVQGVATEYNFAD